ncbi:hypothetical protein VD0004_g8152 [Verticillium dahliae]|nr:hypothetical protein VD0004_g8152 [Verticillium dahliae]PNH66973.1 hypothetical protein VD0001_g7976 [Verticillium dahliae]
MSSDLAAFHALLTSLPTTRILALCGAGLSASSGLPTSPRPRPSPPTRPSRRARVCVVHVEVGRDRREGVDFVLEGDAAVLLPRMLEPLIGALEE